MRLAAFALLILSACAGPRPCTQTLCVARLEGTLELRGWNATVRATSTTPKPPVPSDSEVTMVYGSADFINGKTRVFASEGSVFKFSVSTASIASIEVSSGSVMVSISSASPVSLTPGSPFLLK